MPLFLGTRRGLLGRKEPPRVGEAAWCLAAMPPPRCRSSGYWWPGWFRDFLPGPQSAWESGPGPGSPASSGSLGVWVPRADLHAAGPRSPPPTTSGSDGELLGQAAPTCLSPDFVPCKLEGAGEVRGESREPGTGFSLRDGRQVTGLSRPATPWSGEGVSPGHSLAWSS